MKSLIYLTTFLPLLLSNLSITAQDSNWKIFHQDHFTISLPSTSEIVPKEQFKDGSGSTGIIVLGKDTVKYSVGKDIFTSLELQIQKNEEVKASGYKGSSVISDLKKTRHIVIDTTKEKLFIIDNGIKEKNCKKEKCVLEASCENLQSKQKVILGSTYNSISPEARKIILKALRTIEFR
jgi:hypothetical protein